MGSKASKGMNVFVVLACATGCGGETGGGGLAPCPAADDWWSQLVQARSEDGFEEGPCELLPVTRAQLSEPRISAYETACANYDTEAARCGRASGSYPDPDVPVAAGGSSGDPPEGPAAAGALWFQVGQQEGGSACSTTSGNFALPSGNEALLRDYGGRDPETGDTFRVVDGVEGVTIECTVSGTGTMQLQGTIAKGDSVSFSVNGTIDVAGGTVSVSEWDNSRVATLSGECELETSWDNGTKGFVAPGAIWARLTCPDFSADLESCAASGVFVLENCER